MIVNRKITVERLAFSGAPQLIYVLMVEQRTFFSLPVHGGFLFSLQNTVIWQVRRADMRLVDNSNQADTHIIYLAEMPGSLLLCDEPKPHTGAHSPGRFLSRTMMMEREFRNPHINITIIVFVVVVEML